MTDKPPKPPSYLSPESKRWFAYILATYTLESHHERILTLACEAWDRSRQARKTLDEDGLTYEDRFGAPRARPEVAIERDSRIAFARLTRELGLDAEEPPKAEFLRPHKLAKKGKRRKTDPAEEDQKYLIL